MAKKIYALATLDTIGSELEFLVSQLKQAIAKAGAANHFEIQVVDVSTLNPTDSTDISTAEILRGTELPTHDRGSAIATMATALKDWILFQPQRNDLAGMVGIGGSGGTALITAAMRALPIGIPKVMLSTMASGNTAPYVDCSDITMLYSVVDVAGLNVVSRKVLSNAANALAGMVLGQQQESAEPSRPTLGMTMFGVTTPCVTRVRKRMENLGFDCLVFHATGSGGRAMEKLVDSGMIQGVIDVTTTEVADEIAGGIMPAGEQRFEATLKAEIPFVLSLGALDMVNFGSVESVPGEYQSRQLLSHNPQVTLMRTNVEENHAIARWITQKLNQSTAPVTVCVPEGGLSSLDVHHQPFYSAEIRTSLVRELDKTLSQNSSRRLLRHPDHINSTAFADLLADTFVTAWKSKHGTVPHVSH